MIVNPLPPTQTSSLITEGDINGKPFQLRANGKEWTLHLAKHKRGNPLGKDSDKHSETYTGTEGDPNHARKSECGAFLRKAATILEKKK